jgi:hypothetical protein
VAPTDTPACSVRAAWEAVQVSLLHHESLVSSRLEHKPELAPGALAPPPKPAAKPASHAERKIVVKESSGLLSDDQLQEV